MRHNNYYVFSRQFKGRPPVSYILIRTHCPLKAIKLIINRSRSYYNLLYIFSIRCVVDKLSHDHYVVREIHLLRLFFIILLPLKKMVSTLYAGCNEIIMSNYEWFFANSYY